MIMDFVVLKKKLKTMIDGLDHHVLLPALSKEVEIKKDGDSYEVVSCGKRYVFPAMDVVMLDIPTTTAEEMSRYMTEEMARSVDIPKNVRSISIGLDEERGQTAWYTKVL